MAIKFIVLFFAFCASAFGQQQPSDDCLMACMNNLYKKSPSMDAMKMMDVQSVQVGNTTAMCPRMNDTSRLDTACSSLIDLKKCTDACPDTPIKKLTLSAFKGPQFICVDRIEDVKKNMPCLSEKCPDVQRTCIPKCGSVEGNTQKISDLMRKVHGAGQATTPSSAGQNKDVDLSQITQVIGETCTTISCFMACSEGPVTKDCGKDAYLLQRDLIWTMFSGLAQSMSSMGLQTQWPDECKALSGSAGNATVVAGAHATATIVVGTAVPDKGTGGTPPPATPTPSGGDVKSGKTTATEAPKKHCANPPCGGSATLVPSVLLLISVLVLALRKI